MLGSSSRPLPGLNASSKVWGVPLAATFVHVVCILGLWLLAALVWATSYPVLAFFALQSLPES